MKKTTILILNGPNLNLTGQRDPAQYGHSSFDDLPGILAPLKKSWPELEIIFDQSNHEGDLIDRIHETTENNIQGIVINPGAFTHTSIAIADALRSTPIPAVEVHLSHIYRREEFRRHNLVADACLGSVSGLGLFGYKSAIEYLLRINSGVETN